MLLSIRGLLCSLSIIAIPGVVFANVVSSNSAENSQVQLECRKPWVDYTPHSCIFMHRTLLRRWFEALVMCRHYHGEMVKIKTPEQNDFIKEHFKDVNGAHWTGLLRSEKGKTDRNDTSVWDSFDSSETIVHVTQLANLYCGTVDSRGNWFTRHCWEQRKFICERPKFCSAGLFGPRCEKQCHCVGEACDPAKPVCTKGCLPGWTGPACSELVKAEVTYYCFNTSADGMSMLMQIDVKDITYRVFHGLKDGRPLQSCTQSQFKFLRMHVKDDWTDLSGCGGQRVGDQSMKWQFELQEVEGVESLHDLRVEVECDFSQAESMSRRTDVKHRKQPELGASRVVKLNETRPEVVLSIDNARTSTPLSQVRLGTRVKLSMEIKGKKAGRPSGVSPYNCIARGALDSEIIHITDANGCAKRGSFLYTMSKRTEHRTLKISTNDFSMFKFPSSDEVSFECQFDYCFEDPSSCDNRCQRSKIMRRIHTRSASEKVPTGGTLATRVKVIDVGENISGVSSPSQDLILTTISAVFVVVYLL